MDQLQRERGEGEREWGKEIGIKGEGITQLDHSLFPTPVNTLDKSN